MHAGVFKYYSEVHVELHIKYNGIALCACLYIVYIREPMVGWGGLWGGCVQVYDKEVIVLEPHPHHTLLVSFGEDTAETEEDIVNTHMWCEV